MENNVLKYPLKLSKNKLKMNKNKIKSNEYISKLNVKFNTLITLRECISLIIDTFENV